MTRTVADFDVLTREAIALDEALAFLKRSRRVRRLSEADFAGWWKAEEALVGRIERNRTLVERLRSHA